MEPKKNNYNKTLSLMKIQAYQYKILQQILLMIVNSLKKSLPKRKEMDAIENMIVCFQMNFLKIQREENTVKVV